MTARLITPLRLSADDEALRPELETRLIEELLRRGLESGLALLPVLVFLWVMAREATAATGVRVLFAGQFAILVLRVALLVAWRRREVVPGRRHFAAFATIAAVFGIGWGALVLVLIPVMNPVTTAMLVVLMMAVGSLGVISMAPSPTVYVLYTGWYVAALIYRSLTNPLPGFELLAPVMLGSLVFGLAVMLRFVHGSLHEQFLLSLKLKAAALRDPLTGLRNRRALDEAMIQEVARVERCGSQRGLLFVLVDIDHFKRINDAHGHGAGDAVLTQMGELLLQTARRVDLVVRWGGEEFVVVATDVDPESSFALPDRIRTRVQEHLFRLPGRGTMRLTCSMGVARFRAGTSWRDALAEADRAMYAAKAAGRNRVVSVA